MDEKLNLVKTYKNLYSPSAKEPAVVEVPLFHFLMIDGKGNPNNNPVYQDAINVLYQFSYALKFSIKKALIIDYAVMPLEGLWWIDEGKELDFEKKDDWLWTMMILQPDVVSMDWVEQARHEVLVKKKNPLAEKVRFESYEEGLSVQIMHLGPYSEEAPTVARLHNFAAEKGFTLRGKHHEIYLGDPRRTAPEKLRTVIRQPVQSS